MAANTTSSRSSSSRILSREISAFSTAAIQRTSALVQQLGIKAVDSDSCGMAGALGYEASHYKISKKMAEPSLLPKLRAANNDTLIVAHGNSCRYHIRDAVQRESLHLTCVLQKN